MARKSKELEATASRFGKDLLLLTEGKVKDRGWVESSEFRVFHLGSAGSGGKAAWVRTADSEWEVEEGPSSEKYQLVVVHRAGVACLRILAVYIPPAEAQQWRTWTSEIEAQVQASAVPTIVLGDFNFDILSHGEVTRRIQGWQY